MLKPTSVKVELRGASGTRTTEIQTRGGFPTRHIQAPREAVPPIFGDVSLKDRSEPVPEPQVITPTKSKAKVSSQPTGCKDTSLPTLDDLFAESLPLFIEASRWGRYIVCGPASRIHDNTILIYHNPGPEFWGLYELSKGIFRDLGIRVTKRGATWLAHIPIRVLTDKVFISSGLASVERTLLEHTGIDPVAILDEIRERQFQETQDGIKRVKRNHPKALEAVGDVIGLLAIAAVSWAFYVMMGV